MSIQFSKRFFITFLLLAVMGELLDPSTNFIRAGVAPKNQSFGKVHQDLSKKCLMSENQKQSLKNKECIKDLARARTTSTHSDSESGSCDEYIVCYAILEEIKSLDFIIFTQVPELTYYNIFIDRYMPDIFQPPKV